MSYFAGFWQRIKRSRTFHGYRKPRAEPRLGALDSPEKTLRAGVARWRRPRSPLHHFRALALPALFTAPFAVGHAAHALAPRAVRLLATLANLVAPPAYGAYVLMA